MRAARIGLCAFWLAACGSGGSGIDGPPGGDDTPDAPPPADAPPVGTPLVDRITVTTVATPAGAMAGDSNWRIWGTGNLRVAPVFTVPYTNCRTLVGYTTAPQPGTARVAVLDSVDSLVTTYDLGPYELRGLAAEPDGHFAALLWDTTPDPASLHVTRFDATGAPGWTASLDDVLAMPTDFGIGESRLDYGDNKYGAYFHVHGVSGFANGHEGDALHWVNATTGAHSVGWDWGCSHSMSELLRYDAVRNDFLAACVTDCYPGTSGDFQTMSIGGVYLDNSRKVLDIDAGCNGSVAGELGSAAPSGPGWKLVWNSHQNAATLGQSSYSPGTMNQDIAFSSIAGNLTPGPVVWLTTTPGANEQNSSIARWRPAGETDEQYVVGWHTPSTEMGPKHSLARVTPAGAFLEGPVVIPAVKWGERDDPFRDHVNGDIIWSWFDMAGSMELKVGRVRAGGLCVP